MDINRADVISEIIIKRDYDIPEWLYDEIDSVVINLVINKISRTSGDRCIISRYNNEPKVREFFDRVRKKFDYKHFLSRKDLKRLYEFCPILLEGYWWKMFCREVRKRNKGNYTKSTLINILYKYILPFDCFNDRLPEFIKNSGYDKLYILNMINAKFGSTDMNDGKKRTKHRYMRKLVDAMEINRDVQLVDCCLNMGVPVLFKYGDITDLTRYLDTFINERCHEDLDPNIVNYFNEFTFDAFDKVFTIATKLNERNLKYYMRIVDDIKLGYIKRNITEVTMFGEKSSGNPLPKEDSIKDFNDLIEIFGNNQYGLPMNLQIDFISNGGDIKTMFKNGEVIPEASIIRTQNQLKFLLNNISDEDVYFLLYNSTDFVKNLMASRDLSIIDMVKYLRPLFECPINEELWNVLNNRKASGVVDYRALLINRAISVIGLDGLFTYIPEALQYISPNALFVTRNISKENIRYIPIEKLVPYLDSIIANSDYNKLNLYCNGKYVSLEKVFNGMSKLTDNIVKYKKYGYICDIKTNNPKKLIDTFCKYIYEASIY